MKAKVCHLKNKYPGAQVHHRGLDIDVIAPSGELLVAIRNGIDAKDKEGARDEFSAEPIAKDARPFKLCKKHGAVVKDEMHDERQESRKKYVVDGRVMSVPEAKAAGHQFDADLSPKSK